MFTAYVYTNIYFQGCIESNVIREKKKKKQESLGLKKVRNMLNNPQNENRAAADTNKILIIFLSLCKNNVASDNSGNKFLEPLKGLSPENREK